MTTPKLEEIAKAICREQCAFRGEMPCFEPLFEDDADDLGLSPHCDGPGCLALAEAVCAALATTST